MTRELVRFSIPPMDSRVFFIVFGPEIVFGLMKASKWSGSRTEAIALNAVFLQKYILEA